MTVFANHESHGYLSCVLQEGEREGASAHFTRTCSPCSSVRSHNWSQARWSMGALQAPAPWHVQLLIKTILRRAMTRARGNGFPRHNRVSLSRQPLASGRRRCAASTAAIEFKSTMISAMMPNAKNSELSTCCVSDPCRTRSFEHHESMEESGTPSSMESEKCSSQNQRIRGPITWRSYLSGGTAHK